jgi:hypothetical protein
MGLLYGRAGRLTARFGGFRPGRAAMAFWSNRSAAARCRTRPAPLAMGGKVV